MDSKNCGRWRRSELAAAHAWSSSFVALGVEPTAMRLDRAYASRGGALLFWVCIHPIYTKYIRRRERWYMNLSGKHSFRGPDMCPSPPPTCGVVGEPIASRFASLCVFSYQKMMLSVFLAFSYDLFSNI